MSYWLGPPGSITAEPNLYQQAMPATALSSGLASGLNWPNMQAVSLIPLSPKAGDLVTLMFDGVRWIACNGATVTDVHEPHHDEPPPGMNGYTLTQLELAEHMIDELERVQA